ncbi:hypothetical protein THAOC_27760, partial [Thalassiosira oceanica]
MSSGAGHSPADERNSLVRYPVDARVAPHERAVPLGVPVEPRPEVRRRLAPG